MDDFPEIQKELGENSDPYKSRSRKAAEYNHDTETIFALPPLQLWLKTIHTQGENEPLPDGKLKTIDTQGENEPLPDGKCSVFPSNCILSNK